jgi:hypothetical protein
VKKALVIFCFFVCISVPAQEKDSLSHTNDSLENAKAARKKNYSTPRKASVMSAILPGLGQAYNKKYWKIPVIYAAFGGLGYMFYNSNVNYRDYRKNLIAYYDDDPETQNELFWLDGDQLQAEKQRFKKYRDFAAIGIGLLYILNIVDANVDAHLKTFDISDDLSIHIDPWQPGYTGGRSFGTGCGVSVKINFK